MYTKLVDAVMDNSTGLLRVDDPSKLQSMFFHIGDVRGPNVIFHDNSKFLNHHL